MISKLEVEYIKECLEGAINELDSLADDLDWFVSDAVEGLVQVLSIMEREQKENGET